jgi:glycosyltransferase involved in cell wall biosynthesis
MTSRLARPPRMTVIAAVQPLVTGAAHFNTAMVAALRERAAVDVISWRRMYPPLLYRGPLSDDNATRRTEDAAFVLDWHDPRTWREATQRLSEYQPDVLVMPWLHPVAAAQYRWLLRKAPRGACRVIVCHNVTPHEPFRGAALLTRAALRHADLFVTHSRRQRAELAALGLGRVPTIEAFHPRFVASDLAALPATGAISAERRRQGNPELLLLCFGAIRPYKGVDLALEALALVDPALSVRLVVAGRFWSNESTYRRQVERLGLQRRVELMNRYVPDDEAGLLFAAADAALLPYRSASQSGVVQLAYAHGRPVIATAVGGLPEAVTDGEDGLLCAKDDPQAMARAIERMAREKARFAGAVERRRESHSFERYAELLTGVIGKQ